MSDVEKYGLAAVVFVGGLLVIIAVTKGFGDEDPSLSTQALDDGSALVQPRAAGSGPIEIQPRALPRNNRPTERQPGSGSVRDRFVGSMGAAAPATEAAKTEPVGTPASGGSKVGRVHPLPGMTDGRFDMTEDPRPYPGRNSVPKTVEATPASSEPASAAADGRIEHTIQSGDTLGEISDTYYGSSRHWRRLLELNPGLDEMNLRIGQVLVIRDGKAPARTTPAPKSTGTPTATSAPASGTTYTVQPGDTLGTIAQRVLGSVRDTDRLFEANRHVLETKDDLQVGQVLTIP